MRLAWERRARRKALRVLKPDDCFWFQARYGFMHLQTNTYAGASVRVERIHEMAEQADRKLLRVSGEGSGECYFLIGI